jgi:hypothetical protein
MRRFNDGERPPNAHETGFSRAYSAKVGTGFAIRIRAKP